MVMNLSMMCPADRETVLKVAQPLTVTAGQMVNLGADLFAVPDFAP
jgi:hypothetical protein